MNKIYSWGKLISPSFKQLDSNELPCIETDQQINQISCGSDHCFFKSAQQLYAFGSNEYGQLGININPHSQIQICRIFVPSKRKIVSISCGWDHTLVLDQAGDLFSCGKGQDGALGLGTNQNSYGFKLTLSGVRKISAGKDHSLAISGPKVYGWGNSTQGQLGFYSKKKCLIPKELNVYTSNQVYAGAKYSIFVTIKGVYGTGLNNLNQLGLGHTKQMHYPKRLNIEQEIVHIDGGNYCIAQTESKQYYLWGSGGFGNYKFPTKFPFLKQCEKVSVGLNFGVALKKERVYVWGSNRFGELGIQNNSSTTHLGKQYPFQCERLTKMMLSNIKCGNNFVVGFSQAADQHTWQNMMNKSQINYKIVEELPQMSQKIKNHKSFYRSNSQSKINKGISAAKTKIMTENQNQNSQQKKMKSFQLKINSVNKNYDQFTQPKFNSNPQNQSKSSQEKSNSNYDLNLLTNQLENVKLEIQETNLRNQQLAQQNEELKEILKECLKKLEDKQERNKENEQLQIQNQELHKVLNKKTDYIAQVRHEYLILSNMVQDNQFLRNVLALSQPNYRDHQIKLYQKGQQFQQTQTDAFSKQLKSLKKILDLANQS